MLMETAIDAGSMHALIKAVQGERDAWRNEILVIADGPTSFSVRGAQKRIGGSVEMAKAVGT